MEVDFLWGTFLWCADVLDCPERLAESLEVNPDWIEDFNDVIEALENELRSKLV